MKRIITSAFVILLTIGAAQAQSTTETGKGHKKEHRKGGFEDLNLSADQQAKMKALRADYKKQSAELKSNQQLSAADLKTRRHELHRQHKAQVEAILTPAQKDQLAKKKAEWKASGKEGKKEDRKGNKLSKGTKGSKGDRQAGFQQLNLSSDQQAKMSKIRSDFKSQFETVRNDKALTQDQKKSRMQELKKQQKDQVKSVLTKEQIEKMQTLKKERTARNTK